MNWHRGLWRLWIAASALWLLGVGIIAFGDKGIPSLTNRDCSVLLEFEIVDTNAKLGPADVARCEESWRKKRIALAAEAFAPPASVLIVGVLLGWVIRGFRRPAR